MNINRTTFGLASGAAFVATLMLVWLSLGVGIIGQDGDPANLMYFGVIVVGVIAAFLGRFQPIGMSRALLAMAFTQAVIAAYAIFAKLGYPWSGPLELALLNGFFIAIFGFAAWLFHRSAVEPVSGTA